MLRKANKSDIPSLVSIHLNELKIDFLPSLGERFLSSLYEDLLSTKGISIIVCVEDKKVVGFTVSSNDFDLAFKRIVKNNFGRYAFLLMSRLVRNPLIVKNIVETIFYTKKAGTNVPAAELVVIAIKSEFHRRGLGKKLVAAIEREMVDKKIKKYKVSVNASNKNANSFYKALGFRENYSFYLYGKEINVLTKSLD